tara:strand:+ start:588 stop:1028 length:441 start_codon:yes stop_codon:yes gene_type:complete
MIKTFRGMLIDGETRTIRLSTPKGLVGYRIIKFEAMPANPSGDNMEVALQIWKTKGSTSGATATEINFDNQNMLAALYIEDYSATEHVFNKDSVIFDREVFNQTIYITSTAATGSNGTNYYIELEQIKLDKHEATVATLKDLRGSQ